MSLRRAAARVARRCASTRRTGLLGLRGRASVSFDPARLREMRQEPKAVFPGPVGRPRKSPADGGSSCPPIRNPRMRFKMTCLSLAGRWGKCGTRSVRSGTQTKNPWHGQSSTTIHCNRGRHSVTVAGWAQSGHAGGERSSARPIPEMDESPTIGTLRYRGDSYGTGGAFRRVTPATGGRSERVPRIRCYTAGTRVSMAQWRASAWAGARHHVRYTRVGAEGSLVGCREVLVRLGDFILRLLTMHLHTKREPRRTFGCLGEPPQVGRNELPFFKGPRLLHHGMTPPPLILARDEAYRTERFPGSWLEARRFIPARPRSSLVGASMVRRAPARDSVDVSGRWDCCVAPCDTETAWHERR